MLKVLHIASGDRWAGAEVQLYTLLAALATRADVRAEAVLLNHGELEERLRAAGIGVDVLDETVLDSRKVFAELRRKLSESRPHVVHTHRLKENVLGALANATTIHAPIVRTQHGGAEHKPTLIQFRKRLARAADIWAVHLQKTRVVAVSLPMAESLPAIFGKRRVVLIQNGIDIESIRSQQRQGRLRRAADKYRHVGFLGRLEPVKRVDLVLECAALLAARGTPASWRFHIFGDGVLRAELEAMAQRLDLGQTVQFHGHVSDAVSYLGELDALLMCSDHEGMPMTLLEALAAGTPVVAHAVGGMATVLEGGCGGILVSRHEASAYADALEQLAAMDTSAIMDAAAQRLAERYSAEANADAYVRLYQELSG